MLIRNFPKKPNKQLKNIFLLILRKRVKLVPTCYWEFSQLVGYIIQLVTRSLLLVTISGQSPGCWVVFLGLDKRYDLFPICSQVPEWCLDLLRRPEPFLYFRVGLHSWITTQQLLNPARLSALHCVVGRLALCLCLYFTETVSGLFNVYYWWLTL